VKALWMIAWNFTHEQRWPLFFLLLWVVAWVGFGLVSEPHSSYEDSLMIFRQLAVYAVAFAVFFGSSALAADQRSGRVLIVLSKAVSRLEYLCGLLAGIGIVLAVFCLCTGVTATWILGRINYSPLTVWLQMLALYTACLLAASLTMVFATFLPPLFAAIGSSMVGGLVALFGLREGSQAGLLLPLYPLLQPLIDGDGSSARRPGMESIALGLIETAVLLLLASWIYTRRDLPVVRE
jgi:ABC-type transport system involved in multi-copper enzyme maturation permease subunit